MSTLRTVEVSVSEDLLSQAAALGLDVSEVLSKALQERVNASAVPTARVYVEAKKTGLERERAAHNLRVSQRVFANVPLGME